MKKIVNKYLKLTSKKFSKVKEFFRKSELKQDLFNFEYIKNQKALIKGTKLIEKIVNKYKKDFLKRTNQKIKKFKYFLKSKKNTKLNLNFKLKGINSNNFIFYVYFLAGITISLLFFIFVTKKLISNNKVLEKSIETALYKKSQLPILKKSLSELKVSEEKIINDRDFLEKLISGNNNLQTFLFILNTFAKNNSVEILEFEPLGLVEYDATLDSNTNSSSINNQNLNNIPSTWEPGMPLPSSPIDNQNNNEILTNESDKILKNESNYLLTERIEKLIYKISFKAYFTDLLSFVRDLEKLENVIIFDDFKIKRLKDYKNSPRSEVELESTFSIYGRNKTDN